MIPRDFRFTDRSQALTFSLEGCEPKAESGTSRRGDLVLDPFGGSGSTLIACEKTGRRAALVELEPKYADVIIRRWEKYTGEEAQLESDGRSFAVIAKERLPQAA